MNYRQAQRAFSRTILTDVVDGCVIAHLSSPESAATRAALGPTTMWITKQVFDHLLACADEATRWVDEGVLVGGGEMSLKRWLAEPDSCDLRGVLTVRGSLELLALIARLGAESKLTREMVELISSRITSRLFGGRRDEGGGRNLASYADQRPDRATYLAHHLRIAGYERFATMELARGQLMH